MPDFFLEFFLSDFEIVSSAGVAEIVKNTARCESYGYDCKHNTENLHKCFHILLSLVVGYHKIPKRIRVVYCFGFQAEQSADVLGRGVKARLVDVARKLVRG